MSRSAKVSFLVICHQHAPHVTQCLSSIEAQDWPESEVIVLDNGSSDGSPEIIRDWAARTYLSPRLLLESKRRTICENLNHVMPMVTGEYVACVSADDFFYPGKTKKQVAALEQRGPSYVVAYGDATRIQPDGSPYPEGENSFIGWHRSDLSLLPEGDVLRELIRAPFIPAMTTLIRREALVAMGAFDESLVFEDYDAWLRLAADGRFHADSARLAAYRVLPDSMIQTVASQERPEKILSDARIMAKVSLIPRIEEKIRHNARRRVVSLAIQLLSNPGRWAPRLHELDQLADLPALRLLVDAHKVRGVLTQEEGTAILLDAISAGIIPPTAFKP
jgi:glycosyltransferase involved in cell wall biosynthesis